MSLPFLRPALVIAAAVGLGACSTSGYDSYYGTRVAVGYGNGYYEPYYGWYDDYYYPGAGYYVWDRGGYRHSWSDHQRRYWLARRAGHRDFRENWNGYRYERRGDHVQRDRRHYRDDRHHQGQRADRDHRRDRDERARRGQTIQQQRAAQQRRLIQQQRAMQQQRADQRAKAHGDRRPNQRARDGNRHERDE